MVGEPTFSRLKTKKLRKMTKNFKNLIQKTVLYNRVCKKYPYQARLKTPQSVNKKAKTQNVNIVKALHMAIVERCSHLYGNRNNLGLDIKVSTMNPQKLCPPKWQLLAFEDLL